MFSGCFDYCNICFGELQYKSVITLTDLSFNIAPNGSIKHLSGDKSEELLGNIDRVSGWMHIIPWAVAELGQQTREVMATKCLKMNLKHTRMTRQLKFKSIFIWQGMLTNNLMTWRLIKWSAILSISVR